MIQQVDDKLRREARRLRFLFTCNDCSAFDPKNLGCAYGFPTEPHRDVDLERAEEVIFCKTFELA